VVGSPPQRAAAAWPRRRRGASALARVAKRAESGIVLHLMRGKIILIALARALPSWAFAARAINFRRATGSSVDVAGGTIVVEAGSEQRRAHHAGFAGEQGREVFAIPGTIFAKSCRGTISSSSAAPSWSPA